MFGLGRSGLGAAGLPKEHLFDHAASSLGLVAEPEGLFVVLPRALHVAFGAARIAPAGEGEGMVRLEPDSLVVILQRALHVAFGAARHAAVDEGVGIVRLEPDGFAVILLRALHVAFGAARKAPVVEG